MKSITKASRINTALQVVEHMNNGMSVVDACDHVGLPRSSFYFIIKNNPEAIAEYQAIIEANTREQLGLILVSKTAILQKVIEDGLADNTKPRDRLHIYKTLSSLLDDLTRTLKIENEVEKEAKSFLAKGPRLSHQVSRFSATQTTVTIERET